MRAAVPHGHHETAAALITGGPTAVALRDRAGDGAWFRADGTDRLVPKLERRDTAILDDLNLHKVAGVRGGSRRTAHGAASDRSTAPTSTRSIHRQAQDEAAFAKLKACLRAAAPRAIPDLRRAIRKIFADFTMQAYRYDLAAGYRHDGATGTENGSRALEPRRLSTDLKLISRSDPLLLVEKPWSARCRI
ncbi:hypothetical protein MKK64_03215 [Methylobacterium sp. E-025]|uniref:hypothetical protein n=1 Tax=Methylobacterium sp. E-025 TaxID=2836561 RepID=UPI001FBA56A1|nr:hypothetical protein [Methylobacterium sp. E-025]MCJ2110230.1 hypothetical protein [Methylobacterium sp. E-025]